VERYEAHLERYLEGARRCRTPDELRTYGPPEIAEEGLEPDGTKPEREEMARGPSWALKSRLRHANVELGDLVLRLERRPVPLDVFFDVSIAASVQAGARSIGGSLSARGGGAVEAGAGGVAGGTAGQGRHEVGIEAGLAGAKATFAGGRMVGAEVSVRPVPGVTVHAKRTRGTIEHGLSVAATMGGQNGKPGVKLEARATVGLNLTTAEFVHRGLYRSFFDEGK